MSLLGTAKRKGWFRYIRQGEGQDADERAILNGCWFSEHRAAHVCDWIEANCCLVEGAWRGKPFRLLEWQREILMQLFGWVRESKEWDKIVRRFRWFYLECPKKQGKSPFLGAIGSFLLFGDGGQSTRLFSVATSKKQATLVHNYACQVVQASPQLLRAANVRTEDGYKAIEYPKTGSKWSIAAADAKTADGVNGHCLADELHRWNDWEFWNTLRWMLAAQPEGLFCAITTAGSDMNGICRTQHDKTRAINEGRMWDDQFLGKIYAAEPSDDPHSEKTWLKANPSLGKTSKSILKLSDFRSDYNAAAQDPTQWTEFLRLRLGIWKTAESAWLDQLGGVGAWDAGDPARKAAGKRIDCYDDFTLEQLKESKAECWAGFDGATHHDTTAWVLIFRDAGQGEQVRIVPYYWLPEAEAIRVGQRVPYQHWAQGGYINLTPGDAVDYGRVKADILAACDGLNLQGFAFDPLFQAEWLTQQLSEELGVDRHEFRQVITEFSPPMKSLGRLIAERNARHNGHPILTWQMGNLKAYEDCNGNQRPVRQKRGDLRTIDGCVAAIMGMGLMLASEVEDKPTWYDRDDTEVEFL